MKGFEVPTDMYLYFEINMSLYVFHKKPLFKKVAPTI